ncbi:MAG: hypothetical protein ABEJ65_12405 [bacterium]
MGTSDRKMMTYLIRRLIMGSGLLLLFSGLYGGLVRIGLFSIHVFDSVFLHHGAIMVGGFLGTLIGFERAVALEINWPYLTPISCVLGSFWIVGGFEPFWGSVLITIGSMIMVAIFAYITWKQPTDHAFLLTVGAICWVVGNGFWLYGWRIQELVYWWMGFLILTIVAERLELNRLMTIEGLKRWTYMLAFFGFPAGLLVRIWDVPVGMIIAGGSLISMAVWLLTFDVARRTIWQKGEQAYSGWGMFIGYLWLVVAGVLFVVFPEQTGGFYYDAILHSVFVGFVFSMIFGHSLIIFPTVIGRSIPFTGWLYLPLVLLHASLVLRIGGDLSHWMSGRLWGGVLNVSAIVLFFLIMGSVVGFAEASGGESSARS